MAVAHMVARPMVGHSRGSDPARQPVLDEAMANWSALLYYREAHGEEMAASAMEEQLRGVYKVYRTFAAKISRRIEWREYRNSFSIRHRSRQGRVMFVTLQRLMGDEKYFAA